MTDALIERLHAKVDRLPDATDLMFDLADIRALLARLAEVEAERDAARVDHIRTREQRDTWHTMWREVRANLEATRPVVEAAIEWRATGSNGGFDHLRASLHLVAAVDALPSTTQPVQDHPTDAGGTDG